MEPEAGPDRNLAFFALLLLLTAFWLPYWVIRLSDGSGETVTAFRMFQGLDPVTTSWVPAATGILAVVAALAVFTRLAARSWYHEPESWRRTLFGGMVSSGVAALLLFLWPNLNAGAWGDVGRPSAIGSRTLQDAAGNTVATETMLPGIAWYLLLLATALLAGAWWVSRSKTEESMASSAEE